MAFDFTCLTTRQPNSIASSSASVGARFVTTFARFHRAIRILHQHAAVNRSDIWASAAPLPTDESNRISRRFFFFCKIARASGSNSGAMITSLKISRSLWRAGSSSGRLQMMMPPNGACLSVANALSQAARKSASLPTPHGLVCLRIATVGASNSAIRFAAALMSRMLLKESSLPWSFSKC